VVQKLEFTESRLGTKLKALHVGTSRDVLAPAKPVLGQEGASQSCCRPHAVLARPVVALIYMVKYPHNHTGPLVSRKSQFCVMLARERVFVAIRRSARFSAQAGPWPQHMAPAEPFEAQHPCAPDSKIVFGAGAIDNLAGLCGAISSRHLVVFDPAREEEAHYAMHLIRKVRSSDGRYIHSLMLSPPSLACNVSSMRSRSLRLIW
jgi:hypothetical protein